MGTALDPNHGAAASMGGAFNRFLDHPHTPVKALSLILFLAITRSYWGGERATSPAVNRDTHAEPPPARVPPPKSEGKERMKGKYHLV